MHTFKLYYFCYVFDSHFRVFSFVQYRIMFGLYCSPDFLVHLFYQCICTCASFKMKFLGFLWNITIICDWWYSCLVRNTQNIALILCFFVKLGWFSQSKITTHFFKNVFFMKVIRISTPAAKNGAIFIKSTLVCWTIFVKKS